MPRKTSKTTDRIQRVVEAWKKNAPEAVFAKMTREQFENRVKASIDLRNDLASLDSQRVVMVEQRDDADRASMEAVQAVVSGLKCDPNYGPDHPLLQSMGYARKSARRSGLTRKSNGNGDGNGNEAQAVPVATAAV